MMKRKCKPWYHHSKYCQCDGTQPPPNVISCWFIRDEVEYRLVNVCFLKFTDGTAKWYVYFKHLGVNHPIYPDKNFNTRMGVGAWRYNIYAHRKDLYPEGLAMVKNKTPRN